MARRRRSGRRYHGSKESFSRGSITGASDAVRKLRELGEHVLTEAKMALHEGAMLVVADAKSRVPVKTGKLKESIKAVSLEDGAVYELSADARNSNGISYGQFVEFSPKIAKPFLYPAMDANRNIIANDVKNAIQDAIRRGH